MEVKAGKLFLPSMCEALGLIPTTEENYSIKQDSELKGRG